MTGLSSTATASDDARVERDQRVLIPTRLLNRLVLRAQSVHAAGLKSFGLLVSPAGAARFPYCATDVVFFDPTRNRRNDPPVRAAFEAQGSYFRSYDDAGFVADPAEVLQVHRRLEAAELEPVAMFHTHRRQPANFSHIDFRLHNPAYAWHLIISLREARRPVLAAFGVRKHFEQFGINPADDNENSECEYTGPEVSTLPIVTES